MSEILKDIKKRTLELKNNSKDKATIEKCKLIESHLNDKIPFQGIKMEAMFGILEFLGYDENNIMNTYIELISNIRLPKDYVIYNKEGELR